MIFAAVDDVTAANNYIHVSCQMAERLCLVCEKVIKDKSAKSQGEDSIFCEGSCNGWIHRQCAGMQP